MMKRYLKNEIVAAEPMTYEEACRNFEKVKTQEVEARQDEPGFIVCHSRPYRLEWIAASSFHDIPFDSSSDMVMHYKDMLEEITDFIRTYSKSATDKQRKVIYGINRHLKSVNSGMEEIVKLLK